MKRNILLLLSLILLVTVLWSPVSAAGSARMRISSSSGTVYRGDSFTLTVSLSNDQPVSNGGVILSYDSSVFEFRGGSCKVSNAALAEVSAERGGGVFVLQTDAVVSGTIFTIKMRVKDNAPFGSYSISGTPSLSVSCSLSGTSVSVACKHTYGNVHKLDDKNHESTCASCGQKKTDAHTWDGGTVTKAATCKETGTKKRTCTGCGAVREETVPVTSQHTYGSWSKVDNAKHSRTCTVCGKKETASHSWNKGTVTQKATCQETGTKKLTCTGCGVTKEETVAKTAHAYGKSAYGDESSHRRTCKDCGKEVTEAHQYGDGWQHDESKHFRRCKGCGHEKEAAAHVPGAAATETTDQVCTVCTRILQPKGAHEHSFEETWSADDSGHWYACSGCNEKGSAGEHLFETVCDDHCEICAMTRQPPHAPAEAWSADDSGHWKTCEQCGEKTAFAPHTPGEDAAKTCTLCRFEASHTHSFGKQHSHLCACGALYEADGNSCRVCGSFPWWIVCIVEAVAFGGILTGRFVWMKKRRQVDD